VALWSYGSDGLEQIGHLSAVVDRVRSNGARKLVLVGGSRGGCLSMMAAAEINPPPAGVVLLSCAAVFNRRNPTPTAAWVAKTRVPVLHVTGENDSIPTLDEARAELAAYPVQDKKLVIVPKSYAHGDQLLSAPEAAAVTKQEVMDFLERVTR
jgi:dienelactone hydrolase